MTQLAKQKTAEPVTIEQALVLGDLSGLDPEQRVNYYLKVCSSLGLNPYTKPFDYLVLNGRMVLYARKDCTDQLRDIKAVSITKIEREQIADLFVVTAYAERGERRDSEVGAVPITNLKGEALANAMMKAVTKAKRRVTLSLCGLGMLDESEVDSIPNAYTVPELSYVPTDEREVDDRDIVRSADERIWQRWVELFDQARSLGLNPKAVVLPIDRDALKRRGTELVNDISERQDQLDREDALRHTGASAPAPLSPGAPASDVDQREVARQRAKEGLL